MERCLSRLAREMLHACSFSTSIVYFSFRFFCFSSRVLVSRNADLGFEPVPLPTQAFSQAFKRISFPPVKPARAFEFYLTLLFLCVTLALYLLKQFVPTISEARCIHQATVRGQKSNNNKKKAERTIHKRPARKTWGNIAQRSIIAVALGHVLLGRCNF